MENLGFWAIAAALSLTVAVMLIAAILRARSAAEPATLRDMQVYRDQLAEVDRDLARGTLDPLEAARLRSEIARRLLGADRNAAGVATAMPGLRGAWPALVAVALAVAGAIAVYAQIGVPWYPDMPLARRLAQADADMAARPSQADWVANLPANLPPALPATPNAEFQALMDQLRAQVDPATATDLRGLDLLARNEAALGNLAAAIAAQARLIAVKGTAATAEDHAMLAELLIAQAQGYISPQAEAALELALQTDPRNGAARYYAGLMFAQGGRFDRAIVLWDPLLRESPPDAPWVAPLRDQIEEVARLAGAPFTLPDAPRGPTAKDVEAAADMAPEDRQAMIEGMVAGLMDRLATEGGSAQEWAQLIGALGVLGRLDEARSIADEAATRFADRPEDMALITAAAQAAGIAP